MAGPLISNFDRQERDVSRLMRLATRLDLYREPAAERL